MLSCVLRAWHLGILERGEREAAIVDDGQRDDRINLAR